MAARISRHHRKRDASGHVDPFFQRRKRFETVLRPLGLWEKFNAMPRPFQELFWKLKLPDPAVVFDDDAAKAAPQGMRAAAERYLRAAIITIDNDVKIFVRDFIGVITGVMSFSNVFNAGLIPGIKTAPPAFKEFTESAAPVLERCHLTHLSSAWNAMHSAVACALVQASRLDTRLFTARLDATPNGRGLNETRATVSVTPTHSTDVKLDGKTRPMYPVGAFTAGTKEVQWVTWDGSLLPGGQPGRQYPLYVQSHALRRLHERVRLPFVDPWLDPWLGNSLAEPNIVERHGADLLVEYRIKTWRLGYLIATPLQDCVAIRTFKLLTMENTPERRKLERKLRVSKPDVDWLRLNKLESFTHTDLRSDPLLRRLMEECGCGHLFQLAEQHDFAPQPTALAAEVRKYLRLAA
jgi:hypothetical protein